jgi:hypothetical protein
MMKTRGLNCLGKAFSIKISLWFATLLFGIAAIAQADPHLEPGFPVKMYYDDGTYMGGPGVHVHLDNIDADPEIEILVSTTSVGPVYAFNPDASMVDGWPIVNGLAIGYLASGQLDPATQQSEVVIGWWNGDISLHRGDGLLLPGGLFQATNFITSPASLIDIDGDGYDEIFTGEEDFRLHAYFSDGSPVPGWPALRFSGGQTHFTPTVVDLDGDGRAEIVSATSAANSKVYIYAYHDDATPVVGFPVVLDKGYAHTYISAGDVDGDGQVELVAVGKQPEYPWRPVVHIISPGGAFELSVLLDHALGHGSAPALADMDGDGFPEIIVQTDTAIYALQEDGSNLSGWPVVIGGFAAANSAPVVGDVDGDLSPDVVVTRYGEPLDIEDAVFVINRHGGVHPAFPKALPIGHNAMPAIGDIDNDGRNEIIISGHLWDGFSGFYDGLWVFDLGGPAHGAIEWGQFAQGAGHHARYIAPEKPVLPDVDIALTVVGTPTPVVAGKEFTLETTVENLSTEDLDRPIEVVYQLPAEADYIASGANCTSSDGIVVCSLNDMMAGEISVLTPVVSFDRAGAYSLSAAVNSPYPDPVPSNQIAVVDALVIDPAADLAVKLTDSNDPARSKKALFYTADVTNMGPDEALDATLDISFPAELDIISVPDGCSVSDKNISCALGDLAPGAILQKRVDVLPTKGKLTVSVTAAAASESSDPDAGNNTDTETTVIRGR